MSRLESKAKMGFFATPEKARSLLSRAFISKEDDQGRVIHIFDPCSGDGKALAAVTSNLSSLGNTVCSYGCELDTKRAILSSQLLETVVSGSIFDLACPQQSFGLVWSNPPYDSIRITEERKSERLEQLFFRKTIGYLCRSGIYVLIVPQYVIDFRFAQLITAELENLSVFKFPVEEFERFRQIALIGSRKSKSKMDFAAAYELPVSVQHAEHLNDDTNIRYSVPATKALRYFRDSNPTLAEARRDLSHSQLEREIQTHLCPPAAVEQIPTLMPVKLGHLATLLTSGSVNGLVVKDGKRIVVKGYAYRNTTTQTETTESGTTKIKEIESTTVGLKYFDESGCLYNVT